MKLYTDPDIIVKSRRKGQANARYAATVRKKVGVGKDATSDCLRSPST